MNKAAIYTYISQIESELKSVLSNNRFAELIIAEIINESIIELHEIDNSSMSDEDTAKGCICRLINSFYEPKHLLKVEDKYWNWNERLTYGFRGRIMATPDNLLRFRHAVDVTRNEVTEEKNAMLHAVKNCALSAKQEEKTFSPRPIILILTVVVLLVGIFCYAYSQRYVKMNSRWIFDKWTERSIDILHNSYDDNQD